MATSVHIPKRLLDAVDWRAKSLGLSRNRLIIKALERELADEAQWSAGFFEKIEAIDDATRKAVDDLTVAIEKSRRSKRPVRLEIRS